LLPEVESTPSSYDAGWRGNGLLLGPFREGVELFAKTGTVSHADMSSRREKGTTQKDMNLSETGFSGGKFMREQPWNQGRPIFL
jgi:hypothetical protein